MAAMDQRERERANLCEVYTVPSLSIRKKELCVVATWKNDRFSFGKKVSGF